jgi:hypothetical protein
MLLTAAELRVVEGVEGFDAGPPERTVVSL